MPKAEVKIKGVHRVRKRLADGTMKEYHYVFRGGPRFWTTGDAFDVGTPGYVIAYSEAAGAVRTAKSTSDRHLTSSAVKRFYVSAEFKNLAPRTKRDYEKYLDLFEADFGEDPMALFEERESLAEINEWKNAWSHSPKQYDYAGTVVTRFLNWALSSEKIITQHHHQGVRKLYRSDRSEIIWLPTELAALRDVASTAEERIVVAASEGGLTPQDIGVLKREHVQPTPNGRRLFFNRTKTGKKASIPVTPALASLIDATPRDQEFLVVSLEGRRLTPERASQIIRDLKERANAAAAEDPSRVRIRDELRLYDMRGTAATELLRAGCSLNEIAVTMGWGLRHAANIIEKYAAVVPEVSDEVLAKLTAARKASGR